MELETNTNMCRCCATEGTFKDVKTAYQWMGEEEVYSDMLRDCFDVCLMETGSGDDGGICEVCITQLRNALNFKRQVLYTESQFKLRLQNKEVKGCVVKLEPEHAEDSNESDNDVTGDYDPDFDIKAEDEPKPKRPKRGTTTITLKKAKKTAGETSGKRIQHQHKGLRGKIMKVLTIKLEAPTTQKILKHSDKAAGQQGRSASKHLTVKLETPTTRQTPKHSDKVILRRRRNAYKHLHNVTMILENSNATLLRGKKDDGYQCAYCSVKMVDPADLKSHSLAEHRDITKAYFYDHGVSYLLVKMDITDLRCNICEKSINSLEIMLEHLASAHDVLIYTDIKNQIIPLKFDDDTFTCCVCAQSFANLKLLIMHMTSHYANYTCDGCGSPHMTQDKLREHRKVHMTGLFVCDVCGKSYNTKLKLHKHQIVVHIKKQYISRCGICNEAFKSFKHKQDHLSEAHGVATASYACKICSKELVSAKSLRYHVERVHLENKHYKCTSCDMEFYNKHQLKNHNVTHTGEKNYHCEYCSKSFARAYTLKEHRKIHTKERKYECEHCERTFIQKVSLTGHMKAKHGEFS